MSQGPYPGIVVSNGFAGSEWNIKWIPKHLTTYGYVTICFTPPRRLLGDITQWAYGFSGGIEKLKSLSNMRLSPIYGMVDVETFGVIGLSMGGGGCIEATGAPDSEINAAVPLAPANSNDTMDAARNITVPTQLQVGNNDGMVPPANVLPFYTELISNSTVKEYLSITGGNHIGFIDEFYARLVEFFGMDKPKGIEFAEQRRISRKYFTAWFQYHLKGIDEYYTYIFGEEAQKQVMQVKGLDVICGDPRGIKAYGLTYAVAARGADHLRAEPYFELTNRRAEAKKRFGTEKAADRLEEEGKAALVCYSEKIALLTDSLTMCKNVGLCMDVLNFEDASALLETGTGLTYTPEHLERVLGQAVDMEFELNKRFGVKRKDYTLPERFQKEPLMKGPTKGSTVDIQRMVDEYFKIHGWKK